MQAYSVEEGISPQTPYSLPLEPVEEEKLQGSSSQGRPLVAEFRGASLAMGTHLLP